MHKLAYFYPTNHEKHAMRQHPERPERVEAIVQTLPLAIKRRNIVNTANKTPRPMAMAIVRISEVIFKIMNAAKPKLRTHIEAGSPQDMTSVSCALKATTPMSRLVIIPTITAKS